MRLFVPKIKNWFHVKDKPSIFKKAHSQERKYLHQLRGGPSPRQHAKMNGCFIQNFGQRVKMDTGPHSTVGTNWD